jgi:hypothetical protein
VRPRDEREPERPPAVAAVWDGVEGRTLLASFTVKSTADDGSIGTPRRAIGLASGDTQHDTTVFSSLFKRPQTIDLTGGELELSGSANTTITGPGANLLTINSHQASRVFYFNANSSV